MASHSPGDAGIGHRVDPDPGEEDMPCSGQASSDVEPRPCGNFSQAPFTILAHPHQGCRAGPAPHPPRGAEKPLQGLRAARVRRSL